MPTINRTDHDYLTLLAEGSTASEICETLSLRPKSFWAKMHRLAKLVGIPPQGDPRDRLRLLREEAKKRGYQHEIYYFMHSGMENEDLIIPKRQELLARKEA